MNRLFQKILILITVRVVVSTTAFAQAPVCEPNMDFGLGNFSYWKYYIGTFMNTGAGGASVLVDTQKVFPPSVQTNKRFTIASGSATDAYGGFPKADPTRTYSLQLGFDTIDYCTNKARYYVHVPAGTDDYALIYRYAIVMQDPGHAANQQPRFLVKTTDSATGTVLPDGNFTYVAGSLPGFSISTTGTTDVYYKPWATAILNLSGYAAKTIIVDFETVDCALGGHWGYGYFDMTCGLFAIKLDKCEIGQATSLVAPPGFQSYRWTDSNYVTTLSTSTTYTFSTPSVSKIYHLICTPYPGYGSPDTLTTQVVISNLAINASNDTSICLGSSTSLNVTKTGGMGTVNYVWSPAATLSCTSCQSPIAMPTVTTKYYVVATDSSGCGRRDSLVVTVNPLPSAIAGPLTLCSGKTATLTDGTTGGTWISGTASVATIGFLSGVISGISSGTSDITYRLTATGCSATAVVFVNQVPTATTSVVSNVSCNSGSNGSVSVNPSGGTAPFTYSWSSVPAQSAATATGLAIGIYTVTVTDASTCSVTATATITQPSVLMATASTVANVACNSGSNGSASVAPSGGTAPYTYSWNSTPVQAAATATGLPAGIYTVTVTDANNCSTTASATITQPALLTAGASVVANVSCYGGSNGSVSVFPSGGTAPFRYSWSSTSEQTTASATGLTAGVYSVIVTDANGCTKTVSTTVAQPSALSATATTISNALCNGLNTGSISVSPAGGSAPYTYTWSASPVQTAATATGLTAGVYTVTVKDSHNCSVTASSEVTQPSTLSATASTLTNVSCNGGSDGSVTVSASGGTTPYSYSWNTTPVQATATISQLIDRAYVVTVTDANGCIITSSATVTQPTVLTANGTTLSNVACNGGFDGSVTVNPAGGTAPYTYSWNSSPAQMGATAVGLTAGTYVVTVTDAHNCTVTASATITQPTTLGAAASTLANVSCSGGSDGSVGVLPSGGATPYAFSWSTAPSQATATAIGLPAGTYVVTVTDAHGCVKTATATVTQPKSLTATASTLTNALCNGVNIGSIKVTPLGGSAPYTYSWSTAPIQAAAIATGLTAGTYSVVVTDAHNCTVIASSEVTQPSTLAATASTLTDVSCNGGSNGSVTVAATGGTTPYYYSWNTTPPLTTATVSGLIAGTYVVTVRDANNCSITTSTTVAQPTVLTATGSTLANVVCNGGDNGAVSVTPTGGTSPYTYNWSTPPMQTTAMATGLVVGTYTVIVTDAHSCVTTATATVSQPAALAATASTLANVACNGGNDGSVTVGASGGTVPYAYHWSSVPAQLTATATGLPAGTYTVTVMDGYDCAVSATAIVTEPAALAATASTLSNASCNGFNNGSVNATVAGGTLPYSYSWNTTPVQTTSAGVGLTAGTYTVTVTDDHGCMATSNTTVAEPTTLTATTSVMAEVSCNGGANASAAVIPGGGTIPYIYSWSTTPVQDMATATGLSAGTYTVTVTDDHACVATATVIITEPTALTAAASTLVNVSCNGGNNGSVNVVPGGGTVPYIYNWSTVPAQTDATATGLTAGTYTVTVTDANGCFINTATTVSEPLPLSVSASAGDIFCNGGTAAVTVSATGGTLPYAGIGTYTVSAGTYNYIVTDSNSCSDSTIVTIGQPDSLNLTADITNASCDAGDNGAAKISVSGGTSPYTYQWDANAASQQTATASNLKKGTYRVTVTDKNGCSKVAVVVVGGDVSTMAIVPDIKAPACYSDQNGSVTVNVTGGIPPYSYAWSNGGQQMTVDGLAAGDYSVTVTDGVGCSMSATYTVTQPGALQVTLVPYVYPTGFNVSAYGASDGSVMAQVDGGTPIYSYLWSTGSTDQNLDKIPAGTYSVTVTDQNGCVATASVVIAEPNVLELPTGYSPNGDGKNDYFVIHGINAYPSNQLVIYNRWGNEVYTADGYHNQWNGQNKDGKDLPDGTYFVVLSINGGSITRTGYVDLRR